MLTVQSASPRNKRRSRFGITVMSATKSQKEPRTHERAQEGDGRQRNPTSSSHDWNARLGTSADPMNLKSIACKTGTSSG